MTAAELMAKLKTDPEFQRRESEKERLRLERQQEFEKTLQPYLRSLNSHGFKGESLQEIVKKNSPLSQQAVDILLTSLGAISEPLPLESVVRALGASANPFDGRPLVRCFEATNDDALKWAIVNTIVLSRPHSIDDWLSDIRKSAY